MGQTPVPCEDLLEWGRWMQDGDRHVGETVVGEHLVSTVFLGLDHRFSGEGPPILFETMVFCHHTPGCELNFTMCRYSEWLKAEAGHQTMLAMVQNAAAKE